MKTAMIKLGFCALCWLMVPAAASWGADVEIQGDASVAIQKTLDQNMYEEGHAYEKQNAFKHRMQERAEEKNMAIAQADSDDLDVTMEVIDENSGNAEDVTGTIELPIQARDRIKDQDRLRDRDETRDALHDGMREMQQHREEMRDTVKEQQSETYQDMQNRMQGMK